MARRGSSSGVGIGHARLSGAYLGYTDSTGVFLATGHGHNLAALWRLRLVHEPKFGSRGQRVGTELGPDAHWLATLKGHTGPVTSIAFDADSTRVITASVDGTARIWNMAGKPLQVLRADDGPLLDAEFDRTGRLAVTAGSDGMVRVWRTSDGKQLRVIPVTSSGLVTVARPSPSSDTVLTDTLGGVAQIWDLQTGRLKFTLDGVRPR
jgi:WD40 repeat protein